MVNYDLSASLAMLLMDTDGMRLGVCAHNRVRKGRRRIQPYDVMSNKLRSGRGGIICLMLGRVKKKLLNTCAAEQRITVRCASDASGISVCNAGGRKTKRRSGPPVDHHSSHFILTRYLPSVISSTLSGSAVILCTHNAV